MNTAETQNLTKNFDEITVLQPLKPWDIQNS